MTMLISKNVYVDGRTSLRLEPEFWDALDDVAPDYAAQQVFFDRLEHWRGDRRRTSAVRIALLAVAQNGRLPWDDTDASDR